MVTKEVPVTAHQSWNWYHANPSIAQRRAMGCSTLPPAGDSPRGTSCQRGWLQHSMCWTGELPTPPGLGERVAQSPGGHKVPNPQLQSKLHLETAAIRWGNRAGARGRGLYLHSQVLFIPKCKCGKYHHPTFSTQNNATIKIILARILHVLSDTTVFPGERLTYQKAGVVSGLVKKHSLIFHSLKSLIIQMLFVTDTMGC